MSLSERKSVELRRKAWSLRAEFRYWREQSAPGQRLERHCSQIRRVTRQIAKAQVAVLREVKAVSESGQIVSDAQRLEEVVLELHRIWEFFRRKFALRHVPWFTTYLAAADDFAWACYEPPCKRAVSSGAIRPEAIRQPPLLFFSGADSPFAVSRGGTYFAEVPEFDGPPIARFEDLLRDLPIPVIGIPWHQLSHIPDALVIGHEVGHNVLDDLGFEEELKRALMEAVSLDRVGAWESWLHEVFADLYGILSAGPAFVGSLLDFLATDRDAVAEERVAGPNWGTYPTVYLRALLAFATLRHLGFEAAADAAEEGWRREYIRHTSLEFEPDLPAVVAAVLGTRINALGDSTVSEIHRFTQADHRRAQDDAERILAQRMLGSDDSRCLLAAARLAFETDPIQYEHVNATERILERLELGRENGARAGAEQTAVSDREIIAFDTDAGARLFERLMA
jgi:hypothetical protein